MRTIGTDIDLDVCKAEGYLMMTFDARKRLDPYEFYHFTAYYPDYCEGYQDELITDVHTSLSYLWEIYINDKAGIDSFADMDYKNMHEIDNHYTLLFFASSISAYCGLE